MAFARTAINTTGNFTNGSTSITGVASTTGMFVGMNIYGARIQADTQITAISGTTVTMSKTATGTQTGGDITGAYIIQSGTDTDPSGLSAMGGVTTISQGSGDSRRVIFDLGTNQLRFQGTLTHDPDLFEIVGNVRSGLSFEAGSNITYGIARTVNSQTTYSKGTGLVSTFTGDYFTAFGITWSGGTFVWNGGVIKTFGAVSHGGGNQMTTNSYDCVWQCWGTDGQFRSTQTPTFNALTIQGVNANCVLFLLGGWNALAVKYERGLYQTPAGGNSLRTITNPQFIGNQSASDLNANAGASSVVAIKNPDRFPVVLKMGAAIYADFPIQETVTLNVTNAAGAAAPNVVGYIKDTNNGARINTATNTYIPDRTYVASANASGVIALGDVLTAVFSNLNLTSNTVNLDYRSNYGNTSADFNIYLGGYEYNAVSTRQTLMGNNGKTVAWTMFADTNVSASRTAALAYIGTKFNIDPVAKTVTVAANATLDELYDATKAYKYQGTQTAVETPTISNLILAASGSSLTAYTGWTLIVNTGVTLNKGTKFSFIQFTTVTINGSGKITAVYGSSAGVSTSLELRGVKPGASYVVANNSTKATILFGVNNEVTAQNYTVYFPPGSSGTQIYVARKYYGDLLDFEVITLAEGELWYQFVDITDEGITQTNKTTVQNYTALENTNKLYDYIGYYQTTEPGIKLGNLVIRAGTQLQFGSYSGVVNQSASNVFAISGSTITIKSTVLDGTTKYDTIIATPPATWEPATNEVLSVNIEDANGDSSVTIQAGSVSTYEIWKITDATPPDDYATGTLLDTVGPGKWRFIHADGYKMVIRDTNSNYRVVVEMEKGVYMASLFFGDQVQLAQAATVEQIYTLNQTMQVDLQAIKGTGFSGTTDSLAAISDAISSLPQAGDIVDANIVKVNDIDVDGSGTEGDPWGPV